MAEKADDTPLFQQYKQIREEVEDALLLFRMGDFYELFWDDAEDASEILGIALTSRDNRGEDVPMCGVPHHSFDRYVRKLVETGRKVAVVEQLEDPSDSDGLVDRGVTRLITPGTVIEDELLEGSLGNYLAVVLPHDDSIGVCILESSGGQVVVFELSGDRLREAVELVLAAGVSEVLVERSLKGTDEAAAFGEREMLQVEWFENLSRPDEARFFLKRLLNSEDLRSFDIADSEAVQLALFHLGRYLRHTFRVEWPRIRVRRENLEQILLLDDHTLESLEVLKSRRGEQSGSLYARVDRCRSRAGKRMLRQRLTRPFRDRGEIEKRQRAVRELADLMPRERELIEEKLSSSADVDRITNRLAYGRVTPRDLAALRDTLSGLPEVVSVLPSSGEHLKQLSRDLSGLEELAGFLSSAIAEDPDSTLGEGGVIAQGFHEQLDRYRELVLESDRWFQEYQEKLRDETGIKSLKVKSTKTFGWFIDVTKPNLELVPEHWTRRQTLVNSERFVTEELKEREQELLEAETRLEGLEREVWSEVVDEVDGWRDELNAAATALAELDLLGCALELARSEDYVMPSFSERQRIDADDLRHPVVEESLPPASYIPNDAALSPQDCQVALVTGPNMGGKSTYLRSVALLVILAQSALPVPAERAELGLFDRIFTRIGASDELHRGASTFMVEMIETAEILNNATGDSLVILDEVGRGTSTFDGVAIARAVVHRLATGERRPLTLFATHYHELTELGEVLPAVRNFRMAVAAEEDEITFLYRVEPGATDRSYGIRVAQMAGMPPEVIENAESTLAELEEMRDKHLGRMREVVQKDLFSE